MVSAGNHALTPTRPTVAEATVRAFSSAQPLPVVRVPLIDAIGSVLADAVVASANVPHYPSAAMDGWAVRGTGPWTEANSTTPVAELGDGEFIPIVTGGWVPGATDAVVRSEIGAVTVDDTSIDGSPTGAPRRRLRLTAAARTGEPFAGQHIRLAGEEATAGDTVISAGTRLNPAHVAVAAGCGIDELDVVRRPRVALILTGDEVIEHGIPAPGQVRDSFGPMLPTIIAQLGGHTVSTTRLHDSLTAVVSALSAEGSPRGTNGEPAADVIISTGGTGHSGVDHLRSALRELGATVLIEGVLMRPGAPSLLARLPDGRYLVGLPGNPLAAITGLLILGRPLLAALSGAAAPITRQITLGRDIPAGKGSAVLAPYYLIDGRAVITGWRGSGMLRGLADAAGIVVSPPEGGTAGQEVPALPLPW
jgi:molybdopterin molybdotransferase